LKPGSAPGFFCAYASTTYFQKKKENRKKKKESLSAGGQLRCQGFCDIFYTSENRNEHKKYRKTRRA
jgi:hypothetical protein